MTSVEGKVTPDEAKMTPVANEMTLDEAKTTYDGEEMTYDEYISTHNLPLFPHTNSTTMIWKNRKE